MKILLCPDSFKGSLSAIQVTEAMEEGIRRVFHDAEIHRLPIADGGEGTVEALVVATKGKFETTTVQNPLGNPQEARWGILGDGKTAVMGQKVTINDSIMVKGRIFQEKKNRFL